MNIEVGKLKELGRTKREGAGTAREEEMKNWNEEKEKRGERKVEVGRNRLGKSNEKTNGLREYDYHGVEKHE